MRLNEITDVEAVDEFRTEVGNHLQETPIIEGQLDEQYGVMYPDRMKAWDTVDDMLEGRAPPVDFRLCEVTSFEVVGCGLTFHFKEPGKSTVVLISDGTELVNWLLMLRYARTVPAHLIRERQKLLRQGLLAPMAESLEMQPS